MGPMTAKVWRRGAETWWRRASSEATCCRAIPPAGLACRPRETPAGVRNLIVAPNGGSLDALLGECPQAFLVGELLGQGVNTVTGDYSRGAAGFWAEDGAIVHAVHEVTLAGNLRDVFKGILKVGSDVDTRSGIRCGSVLVEGLTVAGT